MQSDSRVPVKRSSEALLWGEGNCTFSLFPSLLLIEGQSSPGVPYLPITSPPRSYEMVVHAALILHMCEHGDHAAPWGGRAHRAETVNKCSWACATPGALSHFAWVCVTPLSTRGASRLI